MENKEFKVGDTVYIVTRSYDGDGAYNVESVIADKIKTIAIKRGIIKLEKSPSEFKLDGGSSKPERYSVRSTSVELWNPELLRDIRIAKIVRSANELTFEKVRKMDRDDQIKLYDALKLKLANGNIES